MKVDGALFGGFGQPQYKFSIDSRDSRRRDGEKHAACPRASELVDKANKAPSQPVNFEELDAKWIKASAVAVKANKEAPKSVIWTTPPGSNQPVTFAKPNDRIISSTPLLTGADPILTLAGGIGQDSSEPSLTQVKDKLMRSVTQSLDLACKLGREAVLREEKLAESDAKTKKLDADLKNAKGAVSGRASEMMVVVAKHNKNREQQFKLGKRQGREDFLQSTEFESMLKKARRDGFCEFKKSPEFMALSKDKARQDVVCDFKESPEFIALSKAVDYVKTKLGGVNDGSDPSKPDVNKPESSKSDDNVSFSGFPILSKEDNATSCAFF